MHMHMHTTSPFKYPLLRKENPHIVDEKSFPDPFRTGCKVTKVLFVTMRTHPPAVSDLCVLRLCCCC